MPRFLIIGAMKAGTTSLYRWLESTGLVAVPSVKEPNFFTSEWDRGIDWYRSLFVSLPPHLPSGEASVSYADPEVSERAADRIFATIPDVRLIFIARHPLERLRSHYRHELQRNRESRSLAEAVSDSDSPYVRRSEYGRALDPYLDAFPPQQLLVVEFSELIKGDGFDRVLTHLGLPVVSRPEDEFNVTADKPRYSPAARWLFERRLTTPLRKLPVPLRRLGKKVGTSTDPAYVKALEDSRTDPLPTSVVARLREDANRFQKRIDHEFGWSFD